MADEEGFRVATAYVQVDPDTSDFKERLQAALDEAVAGVRADVSVGLSKGEFDADLDEVKARLDELDGRRVEVTLGLNKDAFDAEADDATARLDGLDGRRAEASLGLNKDDFDAEADDATAKLDDLETPRDATLGMDKADFDAEADDAELRLDELERPRTAKLSLSTSGGGGGDSGGGGGLLSSVPGGMFTMLGAGISSLLPAVGGAATGLGLLGGTGALAFGGISKALQAHSQASQNVGQSQAQLAATAFSNSVQIQQAQQAEEQAYQQAAQAASQSAAQIESAKTSEAETVRNAAASQAQALQAVTQAQQQEQTASFGLSQAQYNLKDAWIQARYALEQLNDAEHNSATTIKAARLAVEQAQYQQKLTDQNAMSTSLDRQQAAIAVTQAQEGLTAAQQQAAYTGQEANLQDKAGVAGSQQVLQAKQALKQAMEAVRNAAVAEKDAIRNLTDTEKNNADQIKLAQLAVSQAVKQAAFQQEQAAQAEQSAAQNVSNTYKEQRLQAAATASTSNQAANQFIRDMARLSPAARGFVRELLGMHGALRTLEGIAQSTVLPGVTIFLQGVKSVLPEIGSGVRMMGTAMGQAFGQFGRLMQTPAFKDGLAGLIRNGVQFVQTVLPAFAQFIQMLGKIGGEKGAVTGLSNLLAGLGHGLTGLVTSLQPAIKPLSEFWSVIGKALSSLGPLIGKVIGGLAEAVAPALKALLPGFKLLAGTLGTSLQTALSSLGPLLVPVATAITDVVTALAPLLPSLAHMIAQFATGLTPMLISALPLVKELAAIFAQQMQAGLAQMLGSLVPLVPAIGKLVTSFVPLIGAVLKAAGFVLRLSADVGGPVTDALVKVASVVVDVASKWTDALGWVKDAAMFLWHEVLDPMWHGVESGIRGLYNGVLQPVFSQWTGLFHSLETAALFMWHNVLDPVWQGIEAGVRGFVSAFETVWNRLEGVFRTPVNFLIKTVYDNGIRRLWDDVVGAVGLGSLKLPLIPGLAGGGIVPGRDTGRDSQLVAMRPEEGVLVPEAVRGIGGPAAVHALNEAHSGHRSGASRGPGGMPAFKHGGLLGFIDRGLSDIGHGLVDAAKFAAELATNPAGAITGILDKVVGTDAKGDLGKVMTAVPKTLVGDMAKVFGADVSALMSGGSGGGLGGSATGQAIVKFAESFIGKVPYHFGGTSLSTGIDCSGFTEAIYEHFHFNPPRTSEEQFGWVQRTPGPVLGGLAFFTGSPQDPPPGHVGIVTGANQMVDAYGTGFGVRLNALQGSSGTVMGFGVPPGGGLLTPGAPGGTATPGLITVARYLMSHGASRAAAAGVAGTVAGESGGDPLSVGTGGGGLLGWTPISSAYPYPILTDSNAGHQMAVQLVDMLAYIDRNGSIADLNRSALAGPMSAAWRFSSAYERPLVTGSDIRPDVVSQLYRQGFDSGGWLMPSQGMPDSMPVNLTGQPEAVLTPAESQAWVALVKQMLAGGGTAGRQVVVNQNWLGPQMPSPEMQAQMKRELALTLGSG